MKKIIYVLLCMTVIFALLLSTVSAATYNDVCGVDGGNLQSVFDSETGVLMISGSGKMQHYSLSSPPWVSYAAAIKKIVIGQGVESIGDYAFFGCTALEKVVIAKSVEKIGYGAFYIGEELTIDCYKGSAALEYAGENDIPFTLIDASVPGDTDSDGKINMRDVTNVLQYLAGWSILINTESADANGDGIINIRDVTILLQYIADWNVDLKNAPVVIPEKQSYTVTIYGDGTMETKSYKHGTIINAIAVPTSNKLFVGWYHDAAFTEIVSDSEIVDGDISIYAKFMEIEPTFDMSDVGKPNFIAKNDVASDFSVNIKRADGEPLGDVVVGVMKDGMPYPADADVVLRNLSAPELTDGEQDANNIVSDESLAFNGGVLFAAMADGFEAGDTYQIEIVNELIIFDELMNNGDPADELIRYFNFIVEKEEKFELGLKDGIKFLPADRLSSTDCEAVMEYAGLYNVVVDGDNVTYVPNNGEGSFKYSGNDIAVGDTVAVYKGVRPDERDIDDVNDAAYLKITRIDGDTYFYKCAEHIDVLFTPDVLPVDIDGNGCGIVERDEDTLVIKTAYLNFSDAKYSVIGLNALTTVDVGDFIIFYGGDFGSENVELDCYGCITDISVSGANTTITYIEVTEDAVFGAMDIYSNTEFSAEQIESVLDKEEIVEEITLQLLGSDFIANAGADLADMVLESESVREHFGEDITAEDLNITFSDGETVGVDSFELLGGNVLSEKLENGTMDIDVSTDLKHYSGHSGVRVEIMLTFEYDISLKRKALDIPNDPFLEDFTDESGNALRMKATFYIEEEILFGFNVDGEAIWKVAFIFPYISDYRFTGNFDIGSYIGIGFLASVKTEEKEKENETADDIVGAIDFDNADEALMGKDLAEFCLELKESQKKKDKEVNENAGITAPQGLAKRYASIIQGANDSWIDLFVVDLFEVSGPIDPIGILKFELDVDFVVSASLKAELGMSFVYEDAKRHSFVIWLWSRETSFSTVDISETTGYQAELYVMGTCGIRAGVRAKLLVGLFSTKLDGVGVQVEGGAYAQAWAYSFASVCNFRTKDGVWKKEAGTSGAFLFEVGAYLDLNLVAEVLDGKYSTDCTIGSWQWPFLSVGERENVLDFAYPADSPELNLSMISVDSAVIPTSLFNMKYLDLKNGDIYGEKKDERGKWVVSDTEGNEGAVLAPKNFDSKAVTAGSDDEERFIIEISNSRFTYNPANNTITVNTHGSAREVGEMKIIWKGNSASYNTFTPTRTVKIEWSDPENIRYIQFNSQGGSAVPMCGGVGGEAIDWPEDPEKTGYVFSGWYENEACTKPFSGSTTNLPENFGTDGKGNPIKGITLYAKWTPDNNVVKVEYYLCAINGIYEHDSTEVLDNIGGEDIYTDDVIVKSEYAKDFTGFNYNDKKSVSSSEIVNADGSTVLKLYYDRNKYKVTFDLDYEGGMDIINHLLYESVFAPAIAVRVGYDFVEWQGLPETDENGMMHVPAEDIVITAVWEPSKNTPYAVTHHLEALDGGYVMADSENFRGETGTEVTPDVKEYYGFTSPDVQTETIAAEGSTIVVYQYDRNVHTVTWVIDEDNEIVIDTKFDTLIELPENIEPKKIGHTFIGWDIEDGMLMPDEDITVYAQWETKEYTISFDTGEGSDVGSISALYGTYIDAPEEPVLVGYIFGGWVDKNGNGFAFDEETTMGAENITLEANWVPRSDIKYFVEYYFADVDGKYVLEDTAIKYGTMGTDVSVEANEYTGFAFNDSLSENSGVVSVDENDEGTLVLTLYYDRNEYTVTFDFDNDDADYVFEGVYGADIVFPDEPLKTGYIFGGWTLNGAAYNETTVPADDITLEAKWNPESDTKYSIECYYANADGSYSATPSYTYTLYGETDSEVNVPDTSEYTPIHYTYVKTSETVDEGIIAADGSLVLKLYFARVEYNLVYDYNNGSGEKETYLVAHGANIPSASEPTYPGNRFAGWTLDGIIFNETTMPTRNITLKAAWDARTDISYTVEHYQQNVSGSGYTKIQTVSYRNGIIGETVNIDTVKRDYTGFDYERASSDNKVTVDENGSGTLVIKLYYAREMHTIKFLTTKGSISSITARYGASITMPSYDTAKYGYNSYSCSPTLPQTMPSYDMSITVSLVNPISYNIYYNYNGGSIKPGATATKNYNIITAVTLPEAVRAGYAFNGWIETDSSWNAKSGATATKSFAAGNMGDKYFKADWKLIDYTINYNLNGGTLSESNLATYNVETSTFTLNNPTRAGYSFAGWTGTGLSFANQTVTITNGSTGNRSYSAEWIEAPFTITLDANGGTLSGGTQTEQRAVRYKNTYNMVEEGNNTQTVALPTPAKTGHNFAGWYTAASGGTRVYDSTVMNKTADHTIYAHWTPKTYTVTFDNMGAELLGMTTASGTYSGNNMSIKYDAASRVYTLTNSSSNDPHATIGQMVFLSKGKTYYVHMEPTNGTVQMFYAVNGAFKEEQSLWFNGTSTTLSFTAPSTNFYQIRFDNCGATTNKIKNFWIASSAPTTKCSVTYNTNASRVTVPTTEGYTFVGYYYNGIQYFDKDGYAVRNYNIASDCVMTAKWLKTTAVIEYSEENGKRNKTITTAKITETVDERYKERIYPSDLGIDFDALSALGKKYVKVTVYFAVDEINDGYQLVQVYMYKNPSSAKYVTVREFETTESWKKHTFTEEFNMSNISNNGFIEIAYDAEGWFGNDWKLGYTKYTITVE